MEVHRQQCQACGSMDARNLIVRKADQPTRIFVRCAQCGELVAMYSLNEYYHHGKGIESYLRTHGVGAGESGRAWLETFERVQKQACEDYAEALEELRKKGKPV